MVDLAVRPALILAFAWLVTRCLSKATPATRHLVWHTAVIAVLAVPILLPLTPKFVAPIPLSAEKASEIVATLAQRLDYVPSTQSTSGTSRTSSTLGTSTPGTPGTSGTRGTLIPLFYFLSSLIVVAWFASGWLLTVIAVRRAAPAPDEWRLEANALCAKLRIQRLVDVRVHSGIGTPVVAGLKRTVVVLPTTAGDWDEERRRSVLLHELAHVRRGDLRSQALAQIACAVYWFNPLVWLAAFHLRAERERACDDEVLRSGMRPSAYAQHLLEIAKGLRGSHLPTAALAVARTTQLEGRLLAVLSADRHRTPARWTRWAVTLGISVVSIALVGATPVGRPSRGPQLLSCMPGGCCRRTFPRLPNGWRLARRLTPPPPRSRPLWILRFEETP